MFYPFAVTFLKIFLAYFGTPQAWRSVFVLPSLGHCIQHLFTYVFLRQLIFQVHDTCIWHPIWQPRVIYFDTWHLQWVVLVVFVQKLNCLP